MIYNVIGGAHDGSVVRIFDEKPPQRIYLKSSYRTFLFCSGQSAWNRVPTRAYSECYVYDGAAYVLLHLFNNGG